MVRSYELAWTGRLLKRFGHRKTAELRRTDVQAFVDELVAAGLAPQTVRNLVNALRVMFKWAVRAELRVGNPVEGVELPAGGAKRDRIAPPAEAVELLGAVKRADDRAIYATAFFAGLRRGELMALRACCVDLVERTVTVDAERGSYDPRTNTFGPPKSKAGARTLGIPQLLVPYLAQLDATGDELMFLSETPGVPFSDSALMQRVVGIKRAADKPGRRRLGDWERAGLAPIGLHEARHTYASLMIAANVNVKMISEHMGHSSVMITLDRYGHLLPGSAKVAMGLLDDYLQRELDAERTV